VGKQRARPAHTPSVGSNQIAPFNKNSYVNNLIMKNSSLILNIIFTIGIGLIGIQLYAQHNTEINNSEIFQAVKTGDLNQVRTLLEAEPSLLESKDKDSNTPLIKACQAMNVDIAEYLIDKGADVNAKGKLGTTPLIATPKRKDESVSFVQYLIKMGADVNAIWSPGVGDWTVLHGAINGNVKVVKLLIDNGADINVKNLQGTPLQMAINYKKIETVELLIESGAKLQEFSFGNTELHLSAIKGCAELVPLLVNYGIDVDILNEYRQTPLYYASMHGHRKTVEALIAAGADKNYIVEENYGIPSQLHEKLRDGEAYLWCLLYDGYAVKTKNHLLVFNPLEIGADSEASLANGYFNPEELKGQNTTVLISHLPGFIAGQYLNAMPNVDFILNNKPISNDENNVDISSYYLAVSNDSFTHKGLIVHTIKAMKTGLFGDKSIGYLVETDGLKIFYAGFHACKNDSSQMVIYQKEIDYLKPYGPIDIVILPINGRHIRLEYEPYLYLIDALSPKTIYLMSDEFVNEEPKKCVKVLQSKGIPVKYPEGGIAYGERFHYKKN
jgi:ankyrin repeat protein